MNTIHFLRFAAFDRPTQLSKVGNWVITFLDSIENMPIRLAITNVIPRQISTELQLRTLHIQQTANELEWQIVQLEYFDSAKEQIIAADLDSSLTHHFVQQLIYEFSRYDVELSFI